MKIKTLVLLLLCTLFMSNGVTNTTTFMLKGFVKDASGKGIPGVVVNNGVDFVKTDSRGAWYLNTDTLLSKFVSISTPAAYELPQKDGLASGFYVDVKTAVAQRGYNFVLKKRKATADSFYYIAISDPQVLNDAEMKRWTTETVSDLKRTVATLTKKRPVVGMTLGDLVFDNMPLYTAYKESCKNLGMPIFQCIGNHDFDKRFQDLNNTRYGAANYGERLYGHFFGPTDYSFNIGKIHVITMKNIDYLGGKSYVEAMTDKQIAWIEKDLSYVPKGTTVILNMHAAGWNKVGGEGNMRNAAKLVKAMAGYNVHVFCGHTHFFQNIEVNSSFYQHNIGAACGAWWAGEVNRCGAPNGYMIVEVNGADLKWHYKPTKQEVSYQFRLYAPGTFRTQPNSLVADVWDYDTKCKVEWYQDDKPMGAMQQFTDVDESYRRQSNDKPGLVQTSHLFRCEPTGNYKTVKVVLTNRFGETYSQTYTK